MAGRRESSVGALQDAIFAREGFRVEFTPLGDRPPTTLPTYAFSEMAPQGWKLTDWKRVRLAPYVPFFSRVTVYRGDGTPVPRDIRLGHLRDGYYEAAHGTLSPDPDLAEQPPAVEPEVPSTPAPKVKAPSVRERSVADLGKHEARKTKTAVSRRTSRRIR